MPYLLCQYLLTWMFAFSHPYYISVTEIEYRSSDKELGVSCKFFADDIEAALKTSSKRNVDILKGIKDENGKLLSSYINRHLTIQADGRPIGPTYLGYEIDQGAVWVYFSVKDLKKPGTIKVFNDLLYEYRKEEINMVHVIMDGDRRSTKLSEPDTSFEARFGIP